MLSTDKLIGNNEVFRVESPMDCNRGFVVTHRKTGLWVECNYGLDINQAKMKLIEHVRQMSEDKEEYLNA